MLRTVRVADPARPGEYKLINAQDYRLLVHGDLWHEQEPGFENLPPPAPAANYNDVETKEAARLAFDVLEFQHDREGKQSFAAMTHAERMTVLRDTRQDVQRSRAEYLNQRAGRAADTGPREARVGPPQGVTQDEMDARLAAQRAVVIPEGVVPGVTLGWPLDLASGLPLALTDEERAKQTAIELGKDDGTRVEGVSDSPPVPGAQQGAGGESPAPPAVNAAQPWLQPPPAQPPAAPPAPPVAETTVEKGPGGKWYQMQDGKPVSEGFKTKADAEADLATKNKSE
jgi:hypothetical protein